MASEIEETAARELAEERAGAVASELETARTALADLEARLAGGDSSITGQALASARADVDRGDLLAQAAGRALSDAREAEKVALARATAEALASRSLGDPRKAADELHEVVRDGLRKFAASVNGTSGQIIKALSEAKAAGLVEGKADPLSPVVVRRQRGTATGRPSRDVLEVEGRSYSKIDTHELAVEVLTRAFEDSGFALTVAEEV